MDQFHLNPDEKIIRVVHRHFINIFPVFVATGIVLLLVLFGAFNLGLHADVVKEFASPALLNSILVVLAGLMVVVALAAFIIFRQNRIVVTNQNLSQIEQFGLFGRKVARLNLEDVQDVTGRRSGFFATILNYGDLVVETAGEQANFVFKQAPDPTGLAAFINMTHRLYCDEKHDVSK